MTHYLYRRRLPTMPRAIEPKQNSFRKKLEKASRDTQGELLRLLQMRENKLKWSPFNENFCSD
jgi:hypothetical protein